ncbi:MAG: tetraacyldisaccharide 4'-kinase [Planctomycetota bacterium]
MSSDGSANPLPASLRQALWPVGLLYGAVSAARNGLFRLGWKRTHRLDVPVVSVGNLTVGGTGKTPTVAWLCELARARGRRPGVLARGYGRAAGAELNDEGMLLQRRMPWLLQQQDPDRVAAGKKLLAAGCDYVLLDDGFQHRRLHRDVDVLCLDAARPFGNNLCLPAGDLREFRSGLRRASLLLLTRAGRLSAEQIDERVRRLQEIAGRKLGVYACEHEPKDVVRQPDGESEPVASLRGRRVVLLSAIAKPQSFRATAAALGAEIVDEIVYRDHHRFTAEQVAAAKARADGHDAVLLTTEKDDARLDDMDVARRVLRIELRFLAAAPGAEEFLL